MVASRGCGHVCGRGCSAQECRGTAHRAPGSFASRQLQTVDYRGPAEFAGRRVVVVGGGNSGAQIAADLTGAAEVTWATCRAPRYLPDEGDGHALFDIATPAPVRRVRDAGALNARSMCTRLTPEGPHWPDGTTTEADVVTWCTGFRPRLGHLAPLKLRSTGGHVRMKGTRALDVPGLHLVGDWTGPASATLAGVGRTAGAAVADISAHLPGV